MPKHPPRVAVLVDTSTTWSQKVVQGIVDYVRVSSHWNFLVDWRGVHERLLLPRDWRRRGSFIGKSWCAPFGASWGFRRRPFAGEHGPVDHSCEARVH
jgi:hypothetical protein